MYKRWPDERGLGEMVRRSEALHLDGQLAGAAIKVA
jgi:hypothetical protein